MIRKMFFILTRTLNLEAKNGGYLANLRGDVVMEGFILFALILFYVAISSDHS